MRSGVENIRPSTAVLIKIRELIINWYKNNYNKRVNIQRLDEVIAIVLDRLNQEDINATIDEGVQTLAKLVFSGLSSDNAIFNKRLDIWINFYKELDKKATLEMDRRIALHGDNISRALLKGSEQIYVLMGDDYDLNLALKNYMVDVKDKALRLLAHQHYILKSVPIVVTLEEARRISPIDSMHAMLEDALQRSDGAENVQLSIPLNITQIHWAYLQITISRGTILEGHIIDSLSGGYASQALPNVLAAIRRIIPAFDDLQVNPTREQHNGYSCLDFICRYMLMDLSPVAYHQDKFAIALLTARTEDELRDALIDMIAINHPQLHPDLKAELLQEEEELSSRRTPGSSPPDGTVNAEVIPATNTATVTSTAVATSIEPPRLPLHDTQRIDRENKIKNANIQSWGDLIDLLKLVEQHERVAVFYTHLRYLPKINHELAAVLPLLTPENCWGVVQSNLTIVTKDNMPAVVKFTPKKYHSTLINIFKSKLDNYLQFIADLDPDVQFYVACSHLNLENLSAFVNVLPKLAENVCSDFQTNVKIIQLLLEHARTYKNAKHVNMMITNLMYAPNLEKVAKLIKDELTFLSHFNVSAKSSGCFAYESRKVKKFKDYKATIYEAALLLEARGHDMGFQGQFQFPLRSGEAITVRMVRK